MPFFGDGGDNKLAVFSGREHGSSLRIDYLGDEMVLPDVEALFPFETLLATPGPIISDKP